MNATQGPLLVVEDTPNILELLEVTLRFKGYQVVTARDGQEALEVIEKEHPALVITDILMPKMDGFTLVYRLRSNPEMQAIPVIFLSATYIALKTRILLSPLVQLASLKNRLITMSFYEPSMNC